MLTHPGSGASAWEGSLALTVACPSALWGPARPPTPLRPWSVPRWQKTGTATGPAAPPRRAGTGATAPWAYRTLGRTAQHGSSAGGSFGTGSARVTVIMRTACLTDLTAGSSRCASEWKPEGVADRAAGGGSASKAWEVLKSLTDLGQFLFPRAGLIHARENEAPTLDSRLAECTHLLLLPLPASEKEAEERRVVG